MGEKWRSDRVGDSRLVSDEEPVWQRTELSSASFSNGHL